MKGYTDRQSIENYLLTTIESWFYTQVDEWIGQIEAYIDKATGRNFIADTVASQKVYDGDGTREILIDDCIDVTELKIEDGDALVEGYEDDYVVYPANNLPKTKLKLTAGYFNRGNQNVFVKGKWGYSSAVPDDIKFAATVLVAGIINYSMEGEGEVKSMSIGSYAVTYKDEKQWQDFDRMTEILNSYKKFSF